MQDTLTNTARNDIDIAEAITRRLQTETRTALLGWAIVEASGFFLPKERRIQSNVFSLRWTGAHHDIVVTSLRDCIMALCRLSDPPHVDRQSLLALEQIIKHRPIQDELILRARSWTDPELRFEEQNEACCRSEIEWFLARCGRRGQANKAKHRISTLRRKIQKVRNEALAHSLEHQDPHDIDLRTLRLLLILTARMTQSASMFMFGLNFNPSEFFRIKLSAQRLVCQALEDFDKLPE